MKLGFRDLKTLNAALIAAIEWEASLAEANAHIPVERKKCEARVTRYKKLRMKVCTKLNLKHVDPLAGAKLVTLDELRDSEIKRETK